MRRCITCEGLLPDSHFSRNSPICKTCVNRLHNEYHVEYSPPERRTAKEGATNLIIAIKERAQLDEDAGIVTKEDAQYGSPMAAWRYNWVDSEPWCKLWNMMLDSEQTRTQITSQLQGGVRR